MVQYTGGLLAAVASAVAGATSAVAISWHAGRVGYRQYAAGVPPFPSLVVFFVLGAVPAAALVGYRLVAPATVYALVVALWVRAEADPGPGDPLVAFVGLFAPAAILLMVVGALGESWVRTSVLTG